MATNNLRKILEDSGITQSEFAIMSRYSLSTINRVVNSKKTPAPNTKIKIWHALAENIDPRISIEDVFPDISKPLSIYFDLDTIDAKKAVDVINALSELYGEKLSIVSSDTLPPYSGSSSERQDKVA